MARGVFECETRSLGETQKDGAFGWQAHLLTAGAGRTLYGAAVERAEGKDVGLQAVEFFIGGTFPLTPSSLL